MSLNWTFAGKVTWLVKGKGAIFGVLLLLLASQLSVPLVLANNPITMEALTLTVYLDGFVLVSHELTVNQTFPSINATLLGEEQSEILIVDEQNLPLDYMLVNSETIIHSLGASRIKISYFTQDLTSKTGKYWTLNAEVTTNTTVILPEDASIISLNNVPELIESSNGQVTMVMPSGIIEISYISEHGLYRETPSIETWQLLAILSLSILAFIVSALWFLKRKKTQPQQKKLRNEVDIDKLFEREKHLILEEVQVIHFLAEKHGTAFEAELYEKLNLPRTTTWRLLK